MFEIVRSNFETDISDDYVALGYISVNDNTHSSLIIQYQKTIFEFHYTGKEILFSPLSIDFFHKITKTIHQDEVPAFLAMCNQIKKYANPKYGYFYSGDYYDKLGNHFSQSKLNERMTCVGFCLNVLKGFLESDYLQYTDWKLPKNNPYLIKFCENHGFNPNDIVDFHRRIYPIELITSAFFKNLPIRKKSIDEKVKIVNEQIIAKGQFN
jgi:hypothetical protein